VTNAYTIINEIHANTKDNTALELNVEKLKQEAKVAKMKELVASQKKYAALVRKQKMPVASVSKGEELENEQLKP